VMRSVGTPIRLAIPFTTYGRALKSRAALRAYFASLIPKRRATAGPDMLSVLCNAVSEQGERFSDDDIADHILFLLMAAHDTTTTALTNMTFELGRRPELQEKLRAEALSVETLDEASLAKMQHTYDTFREVLRLYPPVHAIPRRILRDTEIHGYRV